MKLSNVAGYTDIDAYVEAKLRRFESGPRTFDALFELMFSEKSNIMMEESRGYRMIKTTYGEAYAHVLAKSAAAAKLLVDLPRGAVVGLAMNNSLEWIETFWAILRAGYRPLLMNLRLSDETLEYALKAAGAGAVISDGRTFSVRTLMADALTEAAEPLTETSFGTELMLMSSGTSAHVKICFYTAEEFFHQIKGSYGIITRCAQMKKHYEGELKQLTFLPFYHIFGLTAVYVWFAFFSRTFVLLNDLAPDTIVNTIKRHKVTHIFAVPLFWERVYEQAVKTIRLRGEKTQAKFEKGMKLAESLGSVPVVGDLFIKSAFKEVRENLFGESVCFLITGGSAVKPEVLRFFNNIGYHMANGYGMTEIGITSVELSMKRGVRNLGSVGTPVVGVEYKVDEAGELWVRGEALSARILEDGEIRRQEGWFATHDLAECRDGRYYILGRHDDLIVTDAGENLNPEIVERQMELPGVRGVCLTAVETDGRRVPTLLVSVNRFLSGERFAALESSVRDRMTALNLSGQIGRVVYISDPLMTEAEFKLNRTRLAADCAAGRLHPVSVEAAEAAEAEDEITRTVRGLFSVTLGKPPEEIGYTADFFLDEGGTSLDYFAMISQLQNEFGIPFPTDSEKAMNTVEALHDYIRDALEKE